MKAAFIILLVSCGALFGWAQQIEIAVQKGHSASIDRITFNANGRLLASAGADHLIKLWHIPTGKEMASFISALSQPVKAMMFSTNDDFLYVQYDGGTVHTWNIATSTLHSTEIPAGVSFPALKKYVSANGQFEVTIDRFYLRKKNTQTGKTLFSKVPIDIAMNFTSVSVSETSGSIIASNEDGQVYAFDWHSGKSLGILEGHYTAVNQVCFDSQGELFASASADRSIILWDAKTRKQVKRLFGRSFRLETVAFNHSGTQLAVGDELGKGRIIDLQSSRVKISVASWHEQKISDLAFSENDSVIISGGADNRIIAYDVGKDRITDQVKYKHYVSAGDFLLKVFHAYREPYAWVNSVSVSPSGNLFAGGGAWREAVTRSSAEPIRIKNRVTGETDKLLSHQGGVDDICFINEVNFVSIHKNVLLNWFYDASADHYYYRKLIIPSVTNLRHVVQGPGNTIILQSDSVILHYDLNKEVVLDSIHTPATITSIACERESGKIAFSLFNSLVLTSLNHWHTQQSVIHQAHSDRITGIAFNANFPLLATVSWDATIKLWKADSLSLKATIIPMGSDDHIIITPDSYYYGTKNSLKGIGFKFGKQFISPEQFDLRFNRPDIVLERLGFVPTGVVRSFNRAYQKRLQKMNFTEQMLSAEIHLPEINLVTHSLPLSTSTSQFSFTVKAVDSKYKLDRLNVFVNNVPVYGFQGIDLRNKNVQQLEQELNINLSSGRNKIQISCLNEKGVESLLETVEIEYNVKPSKPTLYVAVISVSSYAQDAMNLKYAAKDGRDLITMFRRSGWFDNVVVDSLINARATKENIEHLRERFMQTSVDDQIILFISGHGLLDESLDFYFATYDIDFKNPATRGLRYEDLENLLDGVPSRKKLLLMDACHSGEVDKSRIQVTTSPLISKNTKGTIKTYTYPVEVSEEYYQVGIKTSFELMQELFANVSKGSGAVVISAAAGNSYALESDEWRNGVFTFALLSGLKSKAADANRNGEVTVTELKDYVSKEVERLTQGAQKPTSRRENLEFDFRIW
jgi:WD40 repeat protein